MSTAANELSDRGRFHGMLQVLRFNSYRYLAAALLVAATLATIALLPLPPAVLMVIAPCLVLIVFWSVAALVVSHWVYDRSGLMRWNWIIEYLPDDTRPLRWINIHSGFDDTSKPMRRVLATTPHRVVDLFDPRVMTERSLAAARQESQRDECTVTATLGAIPLADESVDVAFLLLAAHEVRDRAKRAQLFAEIERVLRPGGRVLLVEHLRDPWNFIAFGPGAWHFYSMREWLRSASRPNLTLYRTGRMTPFVAIVVWEKSK